MENLNNNIETVNVADEIKKMIQAFRIGLFVFISFCLRNWIVILILILAGAVSGYLVSKNTVPAKESTFFANINYEMGGTVYNSAETINAKIAQRDSVFLKELGVWKNGSQIKGISITPVVRMENVVFQYDPNNAKNLELFLTNFDKFQDEDRKAIPGFYTYFKQHLVKIKLGYEATDDMVVKIIDYLNTNPNIQKAKFAFRDNLNTRIKTNNEIIAQIDTLVTYKNKNLLKFDAPLIGDQDFNLTELFKIKASFERDNENRYTDMALSDELVVPLERIHIVESKKSILSKRTIIYPVVLILFFFLFSFFQNFYLKMKSTYQAPNQ